MRQVVDYTASRVEVLRWSAFFVYAVTIMAPVSADLSARVNVFPGGYSVGWGVIAIGFSFVARDVLHEIAGRLAPVVAIVFGCAALLVLGRHSPLVYPSAASFLLSGLTATAAFPFARARLRWPWASLVVAGGAMLIDSLAFDGLAFGRFDPFVAQSIAKWWALLMIPVARFTILRWYRNTMRVHLHAVRLAGEDRR